MQPLYRAYNLLCYSATKILRDVFNDFSLDIFVFGQVHHLSV